jgi:hypothetical protein
MIAIRYGLASLAIFLMFSFAYSQSKPGEAKSTEANPKVNLRDYMQAKLKHSQEILKGLAIEDLDLVAKNAQDLSILSHSSTWDVLQTEEYGQHSAEFRRNANALRDAAKKKNLDGAALAYVGVTLNCVNCHKYVRGVRMAKFEK